MPVDRGKGISISETCRNEALPVVSARIDKSSSRGDARLKYTHCQFDILTLLQDGLFDLGQGVPDRRGADLRLMLRAVLSIDGACSGKRAVCAAVLSVNGRIVAEGSCHLPKVDSYVLAAEIAGVALAEELLGPQASPHELTIETDNPDVPRVIEGGYRPPQFERIPSAVLRTAKAFCRRHHVAFQVLPRNSTPGLRRADSLAGRHFWRKHR